MCVIFFYVNSNPMPGGYKLVLASNRDEFYGRPTKPVCRFDGNGVEMYGGMDMEPGREGGTWLAISGGVDVFKIGALLNLTGEPKPRNASERISPSPETIRAEILQHNSKPHLIKNHKTARENHNNNSLLGRGMIVSDFVASNDKDSIKSYNEKMLHDCDKYSAFNFVSIEIGSRNKPAQISLLSNVPSKLINYDEGKCYGFGNSLPSKPFKKVLYGREKFEEILEGFHAKLKESEKTHTVDAADDIFEKKSSNFNFEDTLIKDLCDLLKCREKFFPDDELQRRAPNWCEGLSSLNVRIDGQEYGSRTHSIILIDGENRMRFFEETMSGVDPDGEWRTSDFTKEF